MTRTYIITGAGSGIGAITAAKLKARGDRVVGIDLRGADIDADLSTAEGRQAAVTDAAGAVDHNVDGIIACAGIAAPIAKTISVNYFGATETIGLLLPLMTRSTAPRVAVISSMASLQVNSPELVEAALRDDEDAALKIAANLEEQGPDVGYLIYPSSKRALSRWVRRESISARFAAAGIPLNAVAPGTVITPMTRDLLATPEGAAMVDAQVPMPLNYHQPPESVADLLIWLTDKENTHVTGQTIYCDGGADASLRGDNIWA
jgi:NAD(P)-dependent dehydrogenase (short-subunit alcohol dehydrogenase family)